MAAYIGWTPLVEGHALVFAKSHNQARYLLAQHLDDLGFDVPYVDCRATRAKKYDEYESKENMFVGTDYIEKRRTA